MSLRKLLLAIAVIGFANEDALGATAIGTWQYKDARVSMSVSLKPDGTCRVTASVTGFTNMDAPCAYAVHDDVVIIDWKSLLPIKPYRVPSTTRLYFRPGADVLEMEGESHQVLTRWGAEKI